MFTEKEARAINKALNIVREKMVVYGTENLTSPYLVRQYLQLSFAGLEREEFHVIYLNTQHQLIRHDREFVGTIDSGPVYPREIVKKALQYNAAAVIFAHNHPSGNPEPSSADRSITKRLVEALGLVDIRVLDHMIVGSDETFSMSEKGYL